MSDATKSTSGMTRLRNYFLTGFIVSAPLVITAYIVWSLIGWIELVGEALYSGPLQPRHLFAVRVAGLRACWSRCS